MTSNKEKLLPLVEPLTEMDSIKKQARIVPANINKCTQETPFTEPELLSEFKKAKVRENARLYTSLSKLINWSVYILAIGALVLLCYWAYLQHSLTFFEHSPDKMARMQVLIDKLESIFTNLFTATFGFAGGVCKMFLKNNE